MHRVCANRRIAFNDYVLISVVIGVVVVVTEPKHLCVDMRGSHRRAAHDNVDAESPAGRQQAGLILRDYVCAHSLRWAHRIKTKKQERANAKHGK